MTTTFDPERARDLLTFNRLYHSEFQMDHFITERAGLTPWGMFLQALRELGTRFEGMKALSAERRLACIEVVRQDERSKSATDPLDGLEAGVRRDQAAMRLEGLDRNIRETWRELVRFYAQAVALRATLPAELTDDVRAKLEEQRWEALLKRQAAIDIATTGRVGPGTLESIWSTPMGLRMRLLQALQDPGGLLATAQSHTPAMPAFEVPELPAGANPEALLASVGA